MSDETYLGDGLYASFDAQARMIILRAPRERGDHWIGLEMDTLHALTDYAQRKFCALLHEAAKEMKQ